MCTVMDNAGTVLEHVVLTLAMSWASQRRPSAALRYVDTHAMAPVNHPVRPGNPLLVTQLLDAAAIGPVAQGAPPIAKPYIDSLQISAGQRTAGAADYYPTHFIHAIRGAQAAGRPINGYIFEIDTVPGGRRAAIAAWLANPAAVAACGVAANPAWTVTLAPPPGDFRDAASWSGFGAALGSGDVLVAFSDPMGFKPKMTNNRADMEPADFTIIWPHFAALRPMPSIVVHVIFAIGGNAGAWGGSYLTATNAIHASWTAAIASAGVPIATPNSASARFGVQWGGFLVVVCAWESGPSAAGLSAAFPILQSDILATLRPLWPGRNRRLVFH